MGIRASISSLLLRARSICAPAATIEGDFGELQAHREVVRFSDPRDHGHARRVGADAVRATDCVLAQPQFIDDSSHVKLFSLYIGPNETKTITVTSTDFPPAFQMYGPAWGVPCYYDYEGCGGGVREHQQERHRVVHGHGRGRRRLQRFLPGPGRSAAGARHCSSAHVELCQFLNFPGQYTIAVGSFFGAVGSFTIAVTDGSPAPVRIVGPDAPVAESDAELPSQEATARERSI